MDLNPEVDLRSAIEEFAYYSDEPSADAGALPVWFLSELCKRKTTVARSAARERTNCSAGTSPIALIAWRVPSVQFPAPPRWG